MRFDKFQKELKAHNESGFHWYQKLSHTEVKVWLNALEFFPNEEYLAFLKQIGTGRFYSGSLQIFGLDSQNFKEFSILTEILHEPRTPDAISV